MSATENFLRSAIGDPDLRSYSEDRSLSNEYFTVYSVTLPLPAFRGLPPNWLFAVVNPAGPHQGRHGRRLADAVRRLAETTPQPTVIVSSVPDVHLASEFTTIAKTVFCLDATDFPPTIVDPIPPRQAPFVAAFRRKLSDGLKLPLGLYPYQRIGPAESWRFFGRRSELHRLATTRCNTVIVGPRRCGKTSLMKYAVALRRAAGENAIYIQTECCKTIEELTHTIIRALDPRTVDRARTLQKRLGESHLSNVLRAVSSTDAPSTLFFDELGNALSAIDGGVPLLHLLRSYSQNSNLRVVLSCFGEFDRIQRADFAGPAVNFADVLALGFFSEEDVRDFIFAPLEFWSPLLTTDQADKLLALVHTNLGRHPLFLQYFGCALYEALASGQHDILESSTMILRRGLGGSFKAAVGEIVKPIEDDPLPLLMFLRRCCEADRNGEDVASCELTDQWLRRELLAYGYSAMGSNRLRLLEAIENAGLTSAVDFNSRRQRVAAPMVYKFERYQYPSEKVYDERMASLRDDIDVSRERWGLRAIATGGI